MSRTPVSLGAQPSIEASRCQRQLDDAELEFALLALMILAPLAYFTMRGLVALVG